MAENGLRGCNTTGYVYDQNEMDTNSHHEHDAASGNGKMPIRLNEVAQKYIQDLLTERVRMENHFPLAVKLIDEALERVQLNGRIPTREQYADVYQQRTIKLSQKVHVPIKDKKFNYVGKLLGPKGNSLRRLQEETQCKIVILGRFSMKDRTREEELRNSADLKYAHLNLPLHVEVSTIAPPAEAYARVAYALAEIRRYLIPDKHDDIRQEQFRELMEDPEAAKKISIRQQQQKQGIGYGMAGGNGGKNSNHHNESRNSGSSKPKYYQQSQQHHYNDETTYYRSHNNSYHQQKSFVPIVQRSNSTHTNLPPQAIGSASSSANYSTQNIGLGNAVAGNNGGGGAGCSSSTGRCRAPTTHQFVKK